MITYAKTFEMLKKHKISSYKLRKEKILSESTLTRMRSGTTRMGGGIDSKVIDRLCCLMDCQPGDLMEYVEDERYHKTLLSVAFFYMKWGFKK